MSSRPLGRYRRCHRHSLPPPTVIRPRLSVPGSQSAVLRAINRTDIDVASGPQVSSFCMRSVRHPVLCALRSLLLPGLIWSSVAIGFGSPLAPATTDEQRRRTLITIRRRLQGTHTWRSGPFAPDRLGVRIIVAGAGGRQLLAGVL
ncbi:hypothetical protein C8J57DRAFT_1539133 [Mycena rebaudengoi]|nr:hypothetical protein C8J57DRAFT_1539133 [Mycena rebaudengoi]